MDNRELISHLQYYKDLIMLTKEQIVKFTNPIYITDIISNKLKASFAHEFNDPFDSRFIINKTNIINLAKITNKPIDYIKFYISLFQSVQITSLIKTDPLSYHANLMWGHYANSGKGIAVI